MYLRKSQYAFCLVLLLAACGDASARFPVTETGQAALSDDIAVIRLSKQNIAQFAAPVQGATFASIPKSEVAEYKIGAGDEVAITVLGQTELDLPSGEEGVPAGYRVRVDGQFSYPFIGSVKAAGLTVEQLRQELTKRLADFYPDPQVDVRITQFNSQRVVVGGEVQTPNTQPITTTPITLLEAVNAAGGFEETADPKEIIVRRNGTNYQVDLDAFIENGFERNNPILKGGDVVSVPKRRVREAYLLGEVSRVAPIDLSEETLTLTQAITRQGGLNQIRADARGVFVFRGTTDKTFVFQLDTQSPEGLLLGTRFQLQPSDVVYVTTSPLQRWNDTISRLLPSVSAVNAAQDIEN